MVHFSSGAGRTLALKQSMPRAEFYDLLMRRGDDAGLWQKREELTRGLAGRVLEIGCGTGLMFPHYARDVTVEAVDIDEDALVMARGRASRAACSIAVRCASAMAPPFADGVFDAVVVAFALCSVQSVPAALRGLARVARAGAEVRILEHVRSPRVVSGALMALLDPLWVVLNGQGCHMARRTERELVRAGLDILNVEDFQVFAQGLPAFPMRRIRARIPA
jgi:ubiquinone/menaquinone biosynthesis C-methylase UbiE